jgi:hypothetical protein
MVQRGVRECIAWEVMGLFKISHLTILGGDRGGNLLRGPWVTVMVEKHFKGKSRYRVYNVVAHASRRRPYMGPGTRK